MNYKRVLSLIVLVFLGVSLFISIIFVTDTNKTNIVKRYLQQAVAGKGSIQISLEQILRSPVALRQDSSVLIKYIRLNYLITPSTKRYNLSNGNVKDPSKGQSAVIKEILTNKSGGFFVECGALDGETRSNTLAFEKYFNWNGILIEGDPKNAQLIQDKHRKAYVVPACLSIMPYPKAEVFEKHFNLGKIVDVSVPVNDEQFAEVQCFPLYSILLSVGVTKVDYFSLDVEGNEVDILKTIPWDKVNITTISVEYFHTKGGRKALRHYMESLGYIMYATVTAKKNRANDFIFYHPLLLGKKL